MKTRLSPTSWVLTTPTAHRGLHNELLPENSLSSFQNAVSLGYPIELDLQMSLDGELFVFHDDNLVRMTGFDKDIRDTKAEEIKSLTLKNSTEKIPTFKEVLFLVEGKVPLLIEVKQQKRKGIEKKIIAHLKNYSGEFAIQSFDPTVLLKFKKLMPDAIRGQLCSGLKNKLGILKNYVVKNAPLNFLTKPDFINHDVYTLPTKKHVNNNLPLICWTVRTKAEEEKAKKYSLNYVFENITPEK